MNPKHDEVRRVLTLLEAVADSIDRISDDEIRAELAETSDRPAPSVHEIIAAQLARVRSTTTISPGSQVRLKTDPIRGGVVRPGEKVQAGRRMLPVQFLDGSVKLLPESALEVVPPA